MSAGTESGRFALPPESKVAQEERIGSPFRVTVPVVVPLYKLERVALDDLDAAMECARRYGAEHSPNTGERFRRDVAKSYLRGLRGEVNPYAHGRGGNFAQPFRRAYRAGAALRSQLQAGPA